MSQKDKKRPRESEDRSPKPKTPQRKGQRSEMDEERKVKWIEVKAAQYKARQAEDTAENTTPLTAKVDKLRKRMAAAREALRIMEQNRDTLVRKIKKAKTAATQKANAAKNAEAAFAKWQKAKYEVGDEDGDSEAERTLTLKDDGSEGDEHGLQTAMVVTMGTMQKVRPCMFARAFLLLSFFY